jgi:hypothetical protein
MVTIAAAPGGFVALSARDQDDGSLGTWLWGSGDGSTWQPINPAGLPERTVIGGIWGASGLYWLAGQLAESDDPGTLYRSTDGQTWRPSRDVDGGLSVVSVVDGCAASAAGPRDACPTFVTGTEDVDGVIWRSTDGGDTWAEATVADATGWKGVQDAAPVVILGVAATSDGLVAFGNGLPNASDTSGQLQARFWRSTDGGSTWSRVPNAAPLGDLYVRDVAATGQLVVAVGEGISDQVAVALTSSDGGQTWARATTSGVPAEGMLGQVFAGRQGFVGLGYANPAQVQTFPVREFVWTSDDGSSWRTTPAGALDGGGVVDDAIRVGDAIFAVGHAWSTAATGTWEAPFGPGVWRLGL